MADSTELVNSFSELTLTKKILLMMALAGGFAAIAVVWLWTQKPEFQVVYSNLSSEDAGAIVQKLQEMTVPYEIAGGGSAILVPAEQVHDLRLQLAGQGLPQGGGVGFEIFDQTALGTTEFAQKLNFRRALQGELGRTIAQLDEVLGARVHLVVPEKALFSEQQEEARAAVVLSLRPGRQLSQAQIQGIVHLVSGSVEGLKTGAVTIVDSKGQIRTKGEGDSDSFQMSHSQLEYQKNLEQKLQDKIETILSRVVGPNKAVVRVSSTLDFRQVELTEERFDPDTQVARSEQRSQGQSTGSSQSPGQTGIPGVASNIPPGTAAGASGGRNDRNNSQTTNEVINYEISKIVSHVVEPFGKIKRLSVATLIDGTYESIIDEEGVTTRNYIPRTEEEMDKLEEIVKKTMGFSPERQDQLEVVNVAFEAGPEIEEIEALPKAMVDKIRQWLPLVRQITGPLLILLVVFFVTKPIMKILLTVPPQAIPLPAGSAESLSEAAMSLQLERDKLEAEQQAKLEERIGKLSKDDVMKLSEENPQAASQIVKKWTEEG